MKGDMNGFAVYPSIILQASAGFLDLQNWARNIHRGLIGSCDSFAGMAGDDHAGVIFASRYDKAADSVVNALARIVAQLGGTSNGLFDTAATYVNADEDVASRLGKGGYQIPSQSSPNCDQEMRTVELPSARGHASWPVSHIIAHFWPQGDPGRLRQAAEDWQRAAKLIGELADYGQDETVKVTASCQSSAIDAFQANWIRTQQAITTAANAATQISSACSVYSTEIQHLRAKLQHLAEGAGAVGAVGVGLTLVTVGISDLAGGIGEGVIAADAAAAAAEMTATLSASADLAVLAEAAETVDQAAAAMIPVAESSAAFSGSGGGATATLASYMTPSAPGPLTPFTGTLGPIAPPQPQEFPDLSSAQQAEFRAWMAQMQADGRTKPTRMTPVGTPPNITANRAYQLRIAGDREYKLYTTVPEKDNKNNRDLPGDERDEATMWADGVRPQDGAAVDAKYVNAPNAPSCKSLYNIGNAGRVPDFLYSSTVAKQQYEVLRYGSAISDPRNKVNHLEIDTNDNRAASYFRLLMWMDKVPGQVRVVP